jgi:catechol 2,3-dioxygenase-like lactoylglutathione lyase family enzyme
LGRPASIRAVSDIPAERIVPKVIFPVADMAAAVAFYRSLKLTVAQYDDGYAWVSHCGWEIAHLALVPDLDRVANRTGAYFHVADAAAWHRAWQSAGLDVGPLRDEPWDMREFALRDGDGNLLRVGQNL